MLVSSSFFFFVLLLLHERKRPTKISSDVFDSLVSFDDVYEGGVASVFASFEEEEEKEEEKEREDTLLLLLLLLVVKRQMRFRALDRVHAFKRGGNTFERLDHGDDGEEKKLLRALMTE